MDDKLQCARNIKPGDKVIVSYAPNRKLEVLLAIPYLRSNLVVFGTQGKFPGGLPIFHWDKSISNALYIKLGNDLDGWGFSSIVVDDPAYVNQLVGIEKACQL